MFKLPKLIIGFGLFLLVFVLINWFTSSGVTPSLQRAESISGIASIFIIAIGFIWEDVKSIKPNNINLSGKEGFELTSEVSKSLADELAWGSQLILTATAAATILIYWEGKIILRRGIISQSLFVPGEICQKAISQKRLISLVNTSLYPGSTEFDTIVKELPSVLIYPLSDKGFVIVGGWSVRCYTKSDELWIQGWCNKIQNLLSDE